MAMWRAVVAGFLLTAIPNWTGRLPVNGSACRSRRAVVRGSRGDPHLGRHWRGLAAVIDVAFLAVLATVAAREIVAGNNWRNLRVLILLSC